MPKLEQHQLNRNLEGKENSCAAKSKLPDGKFNQFSPSMLLAHIDRERMEMHFVAEKWYFRRSIQIVKISPLCSIPARRSLVEKAINYHSLHFSTVPGMSLLLESRTCSNETVKMFIWDKCIGKQINSNAFLPYVAWLSSKETLKKRFTIQIPQPLGKHLTRKNVRHIICQTKSSQKNIQHPLWSFRKTAPKEFSEPHKTSSCITNKSEKKQPAQVFVRRGPQPEQSNSLPECVGKFCPLHFGFLFWLVGLKELDRSAGLLPGGWPTAGKPHKNKMMSLKKSSGEMNS